MPAFIAVGQKGTLVFLAAQAGFPQEEVADVSWQPQGSQQAVKFSPPDKVEGMAVGRSSYKATVTKKTQGEKYSFPFDIDCTDPNPSAPVMTPVTVNIEMAMPPA